MRDNVGVHQLAKMLLATVEGLTLWRAFGLMSYETSSMLPLPSVCKFPLKKKVQEQKTLSVSTKWYDVVTFRSTAHFIKAPHSIRPTECRPRAISPFGTP